MSPHVSPTLTEAQRTLFLSGSQLRLDHRWHTEKKFQWGLQSATLILSTFLASGHWQRFFGVKQPMGPGLHHTILPHLSQSSQVLAQLWPLKPTLVMLNSLTFLTHYAAQWSMCALLAIGTFSQGKGVGTCLASIVQFSFRTEDALQTYYQVWTLLLEHQRSCLGMVGWHCHTAASCLSLYSHALLIHKRMDT